MSEISHDQPPISPEPGEGKVTAEQIEGIAREHTPTKAEYEKQEKGLRKLLEALERVKPGAKKEEGK